MEQSTPAVSMPSMPAGATVIETSLQPQAPAADGPPAFVSPTDGLGASQAAAMRYVDSNRAAAARDLGNAGPGSLNSRINAALAHALHNGPAPAWLQVESAEGNAADTGAPHVVNDGDIPELAKALEQMSDADAAGALKHGTIVARVSPEIASEVVGFAREAQLPTGTAKAIFDRLGAHADGDGGLGEVSAEDSAVLAERCAQLLGGQEKAEREIHLARAYIKSVGGDALMAKVDARAGTLGFDPALILQLSFLARSKGLDNASHA